MLTDHALWLSIGVDKMTEMQGYHSAPYCCGLQAVISDRVRHSSCGDKRCVMIVCDRASGVSSMGRHENRLQTLDEEHSRPVTLEHNLT